MTSRFEYLDRKRKESWNLGIEHREALVSQYMTRRAIQERPFLKDVVDDLIEEVQGARLRVEVLPLDTFGQTEAVNGRIEVSINSRIAKMPGVKDAAGVSHVTKWHESLHIERDLAMNPSDSPYLQLGFPGIDSQLPRLIVCRNTRSNDSIIAEREFIAENAAVAAAIASSDLNRCPAFVRFRRLAVKGGDLGSTGWQLLYQTAGDIGVNITALVSYFERRGLYRIESHDGKRSLIANPQQFGSVE